AESDEGLQCWARASHRQDLSPEATASFLTQHAVFFKQTVGISRKYFSPFVAVIAGRISASKNVGEIVGEAVPFRWAYHGHFITYFLNQVERGLVAFRNEITVQAHVKECELNLANRLHTCLEILGCHHFFIKRTR